MSTGLACLVNAIEVDSSHNAITLADFVPPGVKGNRSYLPAPPRKQRKIPMTERTQQWTFAPPGDIGNVCFISFYNCEVYYSRPLPQPGLHLHKITHIVIAVGNTDFFFLASIFTYHPHQHTGNLA